MLKGRLRPRADIADCIIQRDYFESSVAYSVAGRLELIILDWNAVSAIAEIVGAQKMRMELISMTKRLANIPLFALQKAHANEDTDSEFFLNMFIGSHF